MYIWNVALHFVTQGRRTLGASEPSEEQCQCTEGVLAMMRKGRAATYGRAASVLMAVR